VFTAHVIELEPLRPEFESTDRKYVDPAELPAIYHLWNELTKDVFEYSHLVLKRHDEAVDGL